MPCKLIQELSLTVARYSCQLSRIVHECHTCGSKTLISCIQANFPCLTHKSDYRFLRTICKFDSIWTKKLVLRYKMMLTGYVVFESSKPCPWANFSQSLEIFGKVQKLWNHLRPLLDIVGTSLEIQIFWRWKSLTFESGKVGSYTNVAWQMHNIWIKHSNKFSRSFISTTYQNLVSNPIQMSCFCCAKLEIIHCNTYTVEPPISGHPRDQKKCPLKRGVRLWEVKNVVSVCM